MMRLRHLLAILLLPFVVVVVVPMLILTTVGNDSRWEDALLIAWLLRLMGAVIFIVGLALFSWCVRLFAHVGHGTLAPWDPTQDLVAVGPYRLVRNPMISGVVLMLFGQALFWGSWAVGLYATGVLLINHIYFVLSEEPGLEQRFGESYRAYKAKVPRWLPRLTALSGK